MILDKVPLYKKIPHYIVAQVKHTADGRRKTSDSVKQFRLASCDICFMLDDDRECALCGCPVDEKIDWASEECPKGRWPAEAPTQYDNNGTIIVQPNIGSSEGCGGCGKKKKVENSMEKAEKNV
jgi:hypothetical protein